MIIDELRIIQKEHGYLPAAQLRALSERMRTSLYQIHGVASFFPHFRLQPPPKVDLGICADMACHLRGAPQLVQWTTERQDALAARGVAVRATSCLGQCDRAPAAVLNETIVGGVALEALSALIDAELTGSIPAPALEPSPPLRIDPYAGTRTYGALQAARAEADPAKLLDALKSSQLRGLGGAGFGTATKWEIVRAAPGDEKYVVCNADESEPGTIKDRFILDHAPHLVIEGMLLAALVTGARTGIIYIRHEYHHQKESLDHEIERCRRAGLLDLGAGIPFDLTVFVSPGGYICGEESALLEALEGRRAEPRNKPPFPGTHGLWGKPTLINNVETLAMVPVILSKGPAWFRDQGSAGASGLKFVGISGHVARPGVYEIGMGTPAREVLERAGGVLHGRPLKAWAPSGPSSGYLPASTIDTPLDFKALATAGSMLGSGALVICADGTCMLDMAANAVRFFKNESCGKCVPCRIGSAKMLDLLVGMTRGQGRREDLDLIENLSEAMTLTSICGLGQVVPAPIRSVVHHFRDEIEAHVVRKTCPTGVCAMR